MGGGRANEAGIQLFERHTVKKLKLLPRQHDRVETTFEIPGEACCMLADVLWEADGGNEESAKKNEVAGSRR